MLKNFVFCLLLSLRSVVFVSSREARLCGVLRSSSSPSFPSLSLLYQLRRRRRNETIANAGATYNACDYAIVAFFPPYLSGNAPPLHCTDR
ncbi:hypothetical protein MASSI9I_40001 [Massilia sp. 9I]|nr:hypothetical protein MASSI9I_40001 [Massilia sp. 9I]